MESPMEELIDNSFITIPSSSSALQKPQQNTNYGTPIRPTPVAVGVTANANANANASPVFSELIMRYQSLDPVGQNEMPGSFISTLSEDNIHSSRNTRPDALSHAFCPGADVTNTTPNASNHSKDNDDHFLRRRMKLKQQHHGLSNQPPKQLVLPVGWNPTAGTTTYSNSVNNFMDSPLLLSIGQPEVSPTTGFQTVDRGWPISYNAPIRSLTLEGNGELKPCLFLTQHDQCSFYGIYIHTYTSSIVVNVHNICHLYHCS